MDRAPERIYLHGGPYDGRSTTDIFPPVVDLDDGQGHLVTYARTTRRIRDSDDLVVYDFVPPSP